MNRPWVIWFVLGTCAAVILGMFSWMTIHALGAERERNEMEAQAQISERMRLSLARMDTVGAELLVVENQRPPFQYESFYSPDDVMTNTLQPVAKGVVLQPSPLLLEERDLVKMHFEIDAKGEIHSPQCPVGSHRELAIQEGLSSEDIVNAEKNLRDIRAMFPGDEPLEPKIDKAAVAGSWDADSNVAQVREVADANLWMTQNANDNWGQELNQKLAYQNNLNTREKQGRAGVISKAVGNATKRSSQKVQKVTNALSPVLDEQIIGVAPLLPIWMGEELLLIREVKMTRSTIHQGIGWTGIESKQNCLRRFQRILFRQS